MIEDATSLLAPELIKAGGGPLIRVTLGPDGIPVAAVAGMRVNATPARAWQVLADVDAYPGRVPMVNRVKRAGDRVTVQLKFRISLFSVGFEFTAETIAVENRSLELRHVAGEPRELRLRFDVLPDGDGSLVYAAIGFDVMSLGWLAKYFLRHHPEIQYGIFPGASLALLDSMRRVAEPAAT
ncbi:MAG TPA: SRPBCC family protein [Polyangia bacterium]|nr:SRPBCC family protein [Polyangia bacterium]